MKKNEQKGEWKGAGITFLNQSKKARFLDLLAMQRARNGVPQFHGIDLSHVDLSGLDLTQVDLTGADLTNANLTGTNLTGANLTEVTFFRTILTNANLSGAHVANVTMDRATQLSWQQAMNQQWLDKAQKSIPGFNQEWKKLKSLDGFNAFETMLKRLNDWSLKNCVTMDEIVAVIEAVIQFPGIGQLVFDMAQGANAGCAYHLLANFNTVQGLARLGKLIGEGAEQQHIVALAKSIVTQNLLDEVTLPVMRNQWKEGRRPCNGEGTGPDVREASQVQLALRYQLSGKLNWLFPVRNPLDSEEIASLHDSDKTFALDVVEKTMNDQSQVTTMLTSLPAWQLYLEHIATDEINAMLEEGSMSRYLVMRQETEKLVDLA